MQRRLVTVCAATTHLAAASGSTAAWMHGLRQRAPNPASVLIAAGTDLPILPRVRTRAARWLRAEDAVAIDGVPTLAGPAMFLSLAQHRDQLVRPLLIDATHRGLTGPLEVLDRLAAVGPISGRGRLHRLATDLAHRVIESVFQDDVLEELDRLGYRPTRSATPIATADGRDLVVDIPLAVWKVAVEPEGDAFHRTREQRRNDRRRTAAYAGTDWVPVPVDWRDWHRDRAHVLASIDAAIASQRRRGIGQHVAPPRR